VAEEHTLTFIVTDNLKASGKSNRWSEGLDSKLNGTTERQRGVWPLRD
jgi:hypothetical protein